MRQIVFGESSALISTTWKVACFACLYAIWLARNGKSFDNTTITAHKLIDDVQIHSFKWLEARSLVPGSDFH
ncbi:hypothetical protein Ancab_018806, partial [Ancistrocladus abbreviatus]